MSIESTLAERGNRYGDFTDHAEIAQALQKVMQKAERISPVGGNSARVPSWECINPVARQALTVIADKIARILSGDPNYADNWHDIQGYAKLVEDRLIVHPIHPATFDHVGPADVEPASSIEDDSERMQAIGQNGNGGEHYGAPDWSKAPYNAAAYIDWTGSSAGFESAFYSDGGDRFYRLDGWTPTSNYVLKLDDGRMDIDYPYFMRPAK